MDTNSLFRNWGNQNPSNSFGNGNLNYFQYRDMGLNQPQNYGGGFINRTSTPYPSNIPVRVVFSPEQIAPQEIPTNGTPALFPLNDGSCIIARSLLENGRFDERVYVLQTNNASENQQSQNSEFEQVMKRLGNIEESLNKVLNDLYGTKNQESQKGEEKKNE